MTRKYLWFAVPVLLALGAAVFWEYVRQPATSATSSSASPVPVVATIVQRQSVSEYLTGLGTVQAFNRVTVHVRVDGELQDIGFTEGEFIHAGDVLAKIDPRPFQAALDGARAKKAQDQAQLVSAQKDLQRAKTLVIRSFETQQVVDQSQAKVDQLLATIDADQAAIANAETQLSYTTIASPLDGRLGMRLIDRGNIVHASDPGGLVVITEVQPIALIFSVPQDYLQDITAAMKKGPLKVRAFGRDNSTKLGEGTLLLIDNQIDLSTGTLRLKASFPNKDDTLWPGQFVNARLELALRDQAVAVPAQVIQRGPELALLLRDQAGSKRREAADQSGSGARRPCHHRARLGAR